MIDHERKGRAGSVQVRPHRKPTRRRLAAPLPQVTRASLGVAARGGRRRWPNACPGTPAKWTRLHRARVANSQRSSEPPEEVAREPRDETRLLVEREVA